MGLVSRDCPVLSCPGPAMSSLGRTDGGHRLRCRALSSSVSVSLGLCRAVTGVFFSLHLRPFIRHSAPPSLALQARPCLGRWLAPPGPQHQACMVPRPLKQACQGPQAPSLAWLLQDR